MQPQWQSAPEHTTGKVKHVRQSCVGAAPGILPGKGNDMKKALCAAALLATIAVMPALAQTTTAPGTTTSPPTGTTTTAPRDEGGFDWGWLGLIGLAGLAPLFMRKGRDTTINRL